MLCCQGYRTASCCIYLDKAAACGSLSPPGYKQKKTHQTFIPLSLFHTRTHAPKFIDSVSSNITHVLCLSLWLRHLLTRKHTPSSPRQRSSKGIDVVLGVWLLVFGLRESRAADGDVKVRGLVLPRLQPLYDCSRPTLLPLYPPPPIPPTHTHTVRHEVNTNSSAKPPQLIWLLRFPGCKKVGICYLVSCLCIYLRLSKLIICQQVGSAMLFFVLPLTSISIQSLISSVLYHVYVTMWELPERDATVHLPG